MSDFSQDVYCSLQSLLNHTQGENKARATCQAACLVNTVSPSPPFLGMLKPGKSWPAVSWQRDLREERIQELAWTSEPVGCHHWTPAKLNHTTGRIFINIEIGLEQQVIIVPLPLLKINTIF